MPHSSAAAAAAHSSSATSSSSAGATASVRVGQVMTPASLVVCARRHGDDEGAPSQPVRRVLRMERHLHERLSAEDGDFLLHRDMARDLMAEGRLAAARDVSGLWARARVEQVLRLPDGDQAQVFLLDHGRSVRVRRPDASLRPLLRREDPARVPPLAQTFILLGYLKNIRFMEVFFGVKRVFTLCSRLTTRGDGSGSCLRPGLSGAVPGAGARLEPFGAQPGRGRHRRGRPHLAIGEYCRTNKDFS